MSDKVFCSKCGAQNASEHKFCGSCGAALTSTTVTSAPPALTKRKRKGRGCLLLIAVLLLVVFARAVTSGDTATSQTSVDARTTAATASVSPSPSAETQPTVEPTSVPAPEPPITVGLGVTRAAVQSVYEKPAIGFTFEESSPVRGQPRIMGQSTNKIAMLELIGAPEDITQATIIVGVPNDNQQVIAENTVYLLGLPKTVMPDWNEATTWITDSLQKAAQTGEEVTTVHNNRQVKLSFSKELGMVTLSVKAQQ